MDASFIMPVILSYAQSLVLRSLPHIDNRLNDLLLIVLKYTFSNVVTTVIIIILQSGDIIVLENNEEGISHY